MFFDDVIHPKMKHKLVDYLHLKAYRHEISYETIEALLDSSKFKDSIKKDQNFILSKRFFKKDFFEYKHKQVDRENTQKHVCIK